MSRYFYESSTPFYSSLVALPLLIAYEVLLALTSSAQWRVRNAVDVWFRQILGIFEISPHHASFVMITVVFGCILFYSRRRVLHWPYLALMIAEAFCYSLALGLVIHLILQNLFFAKPILSGVFWSNLALSLGAGLFEELFFRVLLLNALLWGLRPFFKSLLMTGLVAIFLASFLFSLSHYVGSMADPFQLYSFLFRWIAGLLFTAIYFARGFGIVVYTHALYDIWVLV